MTIGWYVHHHGTGHVNRYLAASRALGDVIALSSAARPPGVAPSRWVDLPLDVPAECSADASAGGVLHWVPRRHRGLRVRMARIARWIDENHPRAFVVDVSVEVALLARLLGVPVVWIAQRGDRSDRPHQLAYAVCDALVAPWTRAVADPGPSTLPIDRTHFVGALSRFDGRAPQARRGRGTVLVLLGGGGHSITRDQISSAALATPDRAWGVASPTGGKIAGALCHGPAADVWMLLNEADVVVGSAGTNVVSETAAARRPLVVIPQTRPFNEQRGHAAALARAGLAESHETWPAADQWPGILLRASQRDPGRWQRLHDGEAAQRLRDVVWGVACGSV